MAQHFHLRPASLPDPPAINQSFSISCAARAARADALYILGDLFEYWAGDDDIGSVQRGGRALHCATSHAPASALFLMHGNRDFLIGDAFAARRRRQTLADPTLIDLYGTRTLLMHGDTLCTDDVEYQEFRRNVRNPQYQRAVSGAAACRRRKQIIAGLRAENDGRETGRNRRAIMDVTPATVRTRCCASTAIRA